MAAAIILFCEMAKRDFLCAIHCVFLTKHLVLSYLKGEHIYYLDCLLRVLLKMDIQIKYNKSRLIPIFMYYKSMKGLIILKNKRMCIGGGQV
ncbi:hypothetical protein [Bacillus cereus group sp. BfR-BA-01331]|uniref:hypothetical protein n=1 Tax=Bacillus cereus group sp. BfR-BA-01331 TaxID=2920307 RepID=UPI001F5641F7|nr:hypothetical protein [Bacillus cereus group sp. BfR-BA-01331]